MASCLHLVRDMNLLRVSITVILALLPSLALAQDRPQGVNARGVVESAEITGIDDDEISKDLRDAVQKLVGQPFDQQTADDLVVQIQIAKPDYIATTRLLSGSQPDRVKVMFVLEKTDEKAGAESNVNSRYTVERVEIRDYDESRLSQSIRDEMKKLVGEKLDRRRTAAKTLRGAEGGKGKRPATYCPRLRDPRRALDPVCRCSETTFRLPLQTKLQHRSHGSDQSRKQRPPPVWRSQ
jgi:hypothetical protein